MRQCVAKVFILIGVALLAVGSAIVVSYIHKSMEYERQYELNKPVQILVQKNESSVPVKKDLVVGDLPHITIMEEDQMLEEVVTYKSTLEIPKLGVLVKVKQGVDSNILRGAVGHHDTTVDIGENGNCVIAGHGSRTYKQVFSRLEEMEMFDSFYVYDADGVKHIYFVTNRFTCRPNSVGILSVGDTDKSVVTLYTCTESGDMRFVVVGTEFTVKELNAFKREYRADKITSLVRMNESMELEPISVELSLLGSIGKRIYRVPFFHNDVGKVLDLGNFRLGMTEVKVQVIPNPYKGGVFDDLAWH